MFRVASSILHDEILAVIPVKGVGKEWLVLQGIDFQLVGSVKTVLFLAERLRCLPELLFALVEAGQSRSLSKKRHAALFGRVAFATM